MHMALSSGENFLGKTFGQTLCHGVKKNLYRSGLYKLSLDKSLSFNRPLHSWQPLGKAENGKTLLQGKYPFAGRWIKGGNTPWAQEIENQRWQENCHGFIWLSDLLKVQSDEETQKAHDLVRSWIEQFGAWSPFIYRSDILSNRVLTWLYHYDILLKSTDSELIEKSLAAQTCFLMRSSLKDVRGLALLQSARTQLLVSLYVAGFEKHLQTILNRICAALETQILADGGHNSRCPSTLLAVLELCLEMISHLKKSQVEIPLTLSGSLDKMAPMVRTFRHLDGTLALFHGGSEESLVRIERLLEKTDNHGQAISDARHSGYQRLEAGRTLVLMDVGSPPDTTLSLNGHAALLSLEVSAEGERVLVNCGSVHDADPDWTAALAATAAHNTVVIDQKNVLELAANAGVNPRPVTLSYKRIEENGEILIDATHDGYKSAFGLLHRRSLYLNKTGTDLRVEDKLIGCGGEKFNVCLHLHPGCEASLVHEDEAALIRTPKGQGWHLRVQGAHLEIADSIYAPNPGVKQPTSQLILSGPLRGEGATVKWRLSKIS